MTRPLTYLSGFANHFESEALPNALIKGQNSPQKVPYGLYAEQLSGSAFTAARQHNLSTWLYRIRPSVLHGEFEPLDHPQLASAPFPENQTPPTQMRWSAPPWPAQACHFIESLTTLAGNGSVACQMGSAIHWYAANRGMKEEFFYNADGDFLIVPQQGSLRFHTEMGEMDVEPAEIIVIPRGIKFQVSLLDAHARGYVCENYGAPFRLPELGVLGANALAHPRDFLSPTAAFHDQAGEFSLLVKFQGRLWRASLSHSPLDVVAWHGNYVPYKYPLKSFNAMGSVSFDHPDPSIYTVLTSPSTTQGVANVDFVIFPPRWMVANHTFRPPYYHRNIMSELMGLIHGTYDAKETGFVPGGLSLHNCMAAHGPDAHAYEKAVSAMLTPEYYDNTLAFMFESRLIWQLTPMALEAKHRQRDYLACWHPLQSRFKMEAKQTLAREKAHEIQQTDVIQSPSS